MGFATKVRYERVRQLTARVLESVRRLYRMNRFELAEAKEIESFGKRLVQKRWELKL